VTAIAGMLMAVAISGSFFSRMAPSRREYSLWRRKWINFGSLVIIKE